MKTLIPRIIVAEDSVDLRTLILMVLKKNGFDATAFENGKEALDAIMKNMEDHELPDLVITDINMPEMNGRELIERMRKVHGLDNVNVLVYSSESSCKDHEYDPENRTYSLHKPAPPKSLVGYINEILGKLQSSVVGAKLSIA